VDSSWNHEQLSNARIIVNEGERLGASPREVQIALMTAMRESSLNNLPGGDRDSIGLFQQRDAWGSSQERLDPAAATKMFFTGGHDGQNGLFDYRSQLPDMTLGEAAQKVQVSAFPSAYDQFEGDAGVLVERFEGPVSQSGSASDAVQPISDAQLVDSWHAQRTGHLHEGIDIMAPEGTPIHAMVSGTS